MTEPRCPTERSCAVQTPPAQSSCLYAQAAQMYGGMLGGLGPATTPGERSPVSSSASAVWSTKDTGLELRGSVLYHLHATTKTVEGLITDLAQAHVLLAGKDEELALMAQKVHQCRLHCEDADLQVADLQRALVTAERRCAVLEQQVHDLTERQEEHHRAATASMQEMEALAARVGLCEAMACPSGLQVRVLEGQLQRMSELEAAVGQLEDAVRVAVRERCRDAETIRTLQNRLEERKVVCQHDRKRLRVARQQLFEQDRAYALWMQQRQESLAEQEALRQAISMQLQEALYQCSELRRQGDEKEAKVKRAVARASELSCALAERDCVLAMLRRRLQEADNERRTLEEALLSQPSARCLLPTPTCFSVSLAHSPSCPPGMPPEEGQPQAVPEATKEALVECAPAATAAEEPTNGEEAGLQETAENEKEEVEEEEEEEEMEEEEGGEEEEEEEGEEGQDTEAADAPHADLRPLEVLLADRCAALVELECRISAASALASEREAAVEVLAQRLAQAAAAVASAEQRCVEVGGEADRLQADGLALADDTQRREAEAREKQFEALQRRLEEEALRLQEWAERLELQCDEAASVRGVNATTQTEGGPPASLCARRAPAAREAASPMSPTRGMREGGEEGSQGPDPRSHRLVMEKGRLLHQNHLLTRELAREREQGDALRARCVELELLRTTEPASHVAVAEAGVQTEPHPDGADGLRRASPTRAGDSSRRHQVEAVLAGKMEQLMAHVTLEKGKLAYENAVLARQLAEAQELNTELQAQLQASPLRMAREGAGPLDRAKRLFADDAPPRTVP
eukprot:GGOE01042557.1.p1 GENE.GGOE01042557.1~~GGOE01042557.1.p1  ORF type:complete len:807 (-),score=215.90 GGOE01042557.1:237-2657(-)